MPVDVYAQVRDPHHRPAVGQVAHPPAANLGFVGVGPFSPIPMGKIGIDLLHASEVWMEHHHRSGYRTQGQVQLGRLRYEVGLRTVPAA